MMRKEKVLVLMVVLALMTATAMGDAILTPGDPILAVDLDGITSNSGYPGAEAPASILDGDPGTKYLNFGGSGSGFIVTPPVPAMVQSFTMTTANDVPGRDPSNWELYGTNDEITSADNSAGLEENWTLIASGTMELPEERLTLGEAVTIENTVSYSSYKMVVDTSGDGLMQVADVAFHPLPNGIGPNILTPASAIIATHEGWSSSYPAAEAPGNCIDGDPNTKYLNFGELNSGIIVTPSIGPSVLDAIEVTTANDEPPRDPVVWMVYGTNDEITTVENGDGGGENWTLICGGTMALPDERDTLGPMYIIANQAEPYTSYMMIFETVKDEASANSMQINEVQLYGVQAELPEEPEFDLEIGLGTPVIDGEVDDIWANASTQSLVPMGDPIDATNASVIWQVLYDSENLYVMVDMTDDSLQNDSAGSWQDDSVEIYFDGGNTKLNTPLSGDDHQYTFAWTTEEIQGNNIDGYTDGIEHAQVDTDTGWRIEVKLPWMSIWGVVPQAGDLIGIDCYYNDDDDGGDSRENKLLGFSAPVEGWNDASVWGTAILLEE